MYEDVQQHYGEGSVETWMDRLIDFASRELVLVGVGCMMFTGE
jgi:hypothetical protein